MGKSKKKDFDKKKLRVGKTKPKSTTHTDTSFVAKSINLPNQSVTQASRTGGDGTTSGNSTSVEGQNFEHYLSLCKHHAANTRKEAVVYLNQNARFHTNNLKPLFVATAPLILDQYKSVREAVLELYGQNEVVKANLPPNIGLVTLYVHSAMTHINPDIRAQSTSFLDILLEVDAYQLVRKSWVKTLDCFLPLLGWKSGSSKSTDIALTYGSQTSKVRTGYLESLLKLLKAGIEPEDEATSLGGAKYLPHPDTNKYLLPEIPLPYLPIRLFTSINAAGSLVTDDVDSRIKVVRSEQFWPALNSGLLDSVKEAGQIGRIAKSLQVYLDQIPAN